MTSLLVATLTGCGLIYQPDVQQGNKVTQEMVDKIKVGMTKTEVEYYLGRPLLQDPFHANRWDYFYSFREGARKTKEESNLTLLFNGNQLAEIKGNLKKLEKPARNNKAPKLRKSEDDDESSNSWLYKIGL